MFIDGRNVSLWMEECERRKSKHIVAAEKCRNWTIDNIKHTCTDFTWSTAVLYIKLLHLSSQQKIFVFSNERQCQNGQTHMPCTHSCLQSIDINHCCYICTLHSTSIWGRVRVKGVVAGRWGEVNICACVFGGCRMGYGVCGYAEHRWTGHSDPK